jgi:hypothetical protein
MRVDPNLRHLSLYEMQVMLNDTSSLMHADPNLRQL